MCMTDDQDEQHPHSQPTELETQPSRQHEHAADNTNMQPTRLFYFMAHDFSRLGNQTTVYVLGLNMSFFEKLH